MAQANVRIEVESGRVFSGQVDFRTDDERLWLRSESAGIRVTRPVQWPAVRKAWLNGQLVEVDLKSALSAAASRAEPLRVGEDESSTAQAPAPIRPEHPPLVRSVELDARLGHWDGDSHADGILLDVIPRGPDYEPLAVAGTVSVQLFGERRGPVTRGGAFPLVGQWTVPLDPSGFRLGRHRVELPFQGIDPQFQTQLRWQGLVHARLVVPGAGTFEASEDLVRLRSFSGFRDHLQQVTGSRSLPIEGRTRTR
jgi:hypothetical protein